MEVQYIFRISANVDVDIELSSCVDNRGWNHEMSGVELWNLRCAFCFHVTLDFAVRDLCYYTFRNLVSSIKIPLFPSLFVSRPLLNCFNHFPSFLVIHLGL
jgi:hypothetical protein